MDLQGVVVEHADGRAYVPEGSGGVGSLDRDRRQVVRLDGRDDHIVMKGELVEQVAQDVVAAQPEGQGDAPQELPLGVSEVERLLLNR